MSTFGLVVNGESYFVDADSQMPLLWVLRDLLGLTGTKFSCGTGLCGSCTVLMDGVATHSCTLPVERAAGKNILTIEGLSADGSHPLQKAWIEERVTQCGYCQAGQILTAAALLEENPHPTDAEIDSAMKNTLCRCGTYQRIRAAIHRATQEA